jgi:hypothetical protein
MTVDGAAADDRAVEFPTDGTTREVLVRLGRGPGPPQ